MIYVWKFPVSKAPGSYFKNPITLMKKWKNLKQPEDIPNRTSMIRLRKKPEQKISLDCPFKKPAPYSFNFRLWISPLVTICDSTPDVSFLLCEILYLCYRVTNSPFMTLMLILGFGMRLWLPNVACNLYILYIHKQWTCTKYWRAYLPRNNRYSSELFSGSTQTFHHKQKHLILILNVQ